MTATARPFIAYFRVSTARQGASGLGIEAQQAAVKDFATSVGGRVLAEHVEVESGKNNDRPVLASALRECRLTGAVLLIAKLDRLSRDAHFLLGLEKAGVDFVAADMPNANRFTVGIMALVAQQEREAISSRTKAALAAAKARGKKLGGWRGGPIQDPARARKVSREKADAFASELLPIVRGMACEGQSLRQIAASLSARGILTRRGGTWTAGAVSRVLARSA